MDPRIKDLLRTIGTLDTRSKEIFADKKRALAKGDVEMVKQVGRGKDIISILRASMFDDCVHCINHPMPVRANAVADENDRLPEEEVIAQMSYVYRLTGLRRLTEIKDVYFGGARHNVECTVPNSDGFIREPRASAKA